MNKRNLFSTIILYSVVITIIIAVYAIVRTALFDTDPILKALTTSLESYLSLAEKVANQFLIWSGDTIRILNHRTLSTEGITYDYIPEVRYKKVLIIVLLFIWQTKTYWLKKLSYSLFIIAIHLSVVAFYFATAAHLSDFFYPEHPHLAIPDTIALLSIFTSLFLWYLNNKKEFFLTLTNLGLKIKFFQERATTIFIIVLLYIIIIRFCLVFFEFQGWIMILFRSSQKILELIGYHADVEPFYLIGTNGTIYMAKFCLGFKTMFLFASVVYLTGASQKRRLVFIIAGIIFLNIINIIRFVLLFIHIQKHGDYTLAIDLHDLYNIITYIIVFILWVIWFEKISDTKIGGK